MSAGLLCEKEKGVFTISATPFTDSGELDLQSMDSLIEFYLEKGVDGITILGILGEAQKLTTEELSTCLKHVLNRVNNRAKVIVGVSNTSLETLSQLAKLSMDRGASGVMVAPNISHDSDQKMYDYFEQVFEAIGFQTPVCFQDHPYMTKVEIHVDCFNRLVEDFSQLVMLKHEAWPGLSKLTQIRKCSEKDGLRRVSILCGNGGLYLPQELSRGADGAMTGFAYPEMLVEVVKKFHEGEKDYAEDLFDTYLPLMRYEQQPGFGLLIRKEILKRRGAIKSAAIRAPGGELNRIDHEELTRLTDRLDQKLQEK